MFELSFRRHPFTAEDPLMSKWCSAKILQNWSFNVLKIQIYTYTYIPVYFKISGVLDYVGITLNVYNTCIFSSIN